MNSDSATGSRAFLNARNVRRIVVKLGSGTITDPALGLRPASLRALAAQVSELWERRGIRCVVVTSGAIAAGRRKLGMTEKPRTVTLKQAAAAVGQTSLMRAYERAFEKRGRRVGQILLTHEDFESRERYVNAKNTIEALLSRGIVPIINENDTVATEEIRLGDNDHLAALVTHMVGADLLLLLTDSDGLYTKDPHRFADARRIPVVEGIDDDMIRRAGGARARSAGTGGMASKLDAARLVSSSGTPVVIASGLSGRPIADLFAGKQRGTLVVPARGERASSRKTWIAYARHSRGTITVDDGARKVLLEGGKSLLPAGITSVQGRFRRGDAVSIGDRRGRIFARGIAAWSHDQVDRGKGRRSSENRSILGEGLPPEVVHRDNLTILPSAGGPDGRKGAPR